MEFFYDKKWNLSIEKLLEHIDVGIEILILNKSETEYLQILFTDSGYIVEIRLILD